MIIVYAVAGIIVLGLLLAWLIKREVDGFCRDKEIERIETDGKPLRTYKYIKQHEDASLPGA
jgi:hypothetical protein